MGKVLLLDCTLRDGGYINDWNFGENTIKGFGKKIAQTGIEIFEVGFIKGDDYNPDRCVFPDIDSFKNVIQPKCENMLYVGMLDMSAPIPLDRITPFDENSIDGIRVIFKKDKINEAYEYCKRIQELGYFISVNLVGTDAYSDKEFVETIELFNTLHPYAVSIVDSFGVIKRKQFLRLVYLADNNLEPEIALAYHAHNNLQQAFGNAEALVEMNLKRDIIIDACVFGMGRGAGNLNLELFAEYMNENYDTSYLIEPMLEIMDEYLNEIYSTKFWGYSLPLYLSATTGCHPNYAIYFAEKDSLTVKSFNELLKSIPSNEKNNFNKTKAENYYRDYQEKYVDDKIVIGKLCDELDGKKILILAPGNSIKEYEEKISSIIDSNTVVIACNFLGGGFEPDYVFSSNMRRYIHMENRTNAKCIITSNIKSDSQYEYIVNYSSYVSKEPEIIDNSALMLLRILQTIGIKDVYVAGMDGYSGYKHNDYFEPQLEYDFSREVMQRNSLISSEINDISKTIKIHFVTPTCYEI